MAVEENGRAAPKHRMWPIVVVGFVALTLVGIYIADTKGAFKKREKIAILTWNEDPFWEPTEKGAADAAKEFDVDLTFIRSKPDEPTQTAHLRDLISSGIDGLAISPNNPEVQKSAIDDAASKAIVLTFDSDAPNTKRRGFVGTDDYAAGQIAAEEVRAAIPDGGKVIISVGSVLMSNGNDRRKGLIDDLLDRPFKRDGQADAAVGELKGKNYDIVATVTDGGNAEAATKLVTDAIKANPDVKCIVGLFSYSGIAIMKAVEATGKKDQIKIIGFDESAEEQAAVQSGAIYSSVLQDQYRCGYDAVRVLSDILRGIDHDASAGGRMTALPLPVMHADNIVALRESRVIRQVDTK